MERGTAWVGVGGSKLWNAGSIRLTKIKWVIGR